ncbi:MAG: TMEM175 family protein [Nitrososphaerales archaeon]
MSSPTDESGSQHRSSSETIPRPRIQTLSDLIFGLALSIGALTLISEKPSHIMGLAATLLGFGWSFLILALVWVRYTKIMSVLPVETGSMVGANLLLLFLVSIEPFLYNLIAFAPLPGQLDSGSSTAAYATDMGSIFVIIAYFTHELTNEERKLIPKELLRSYRLQRDTTLAVAALFYVSILPIFWSVTVFGLQVRFFIWMGTFVTWVIRRVIEGRRSVQSLTVHPSSPWSFTMKG